MSRTTTSRLRTRFKAVAAAVAVASVPVMQAPSTATAGITGVSGTTSTTRYTLAFSDDFSGTRIDRSKWGVYNGGVNGYRTAANTIVRDGKLILRTSKVNGVWKGAGVSAGRSNRQTYGKYEMRVRFDRGYGIRCAALLWPASGGWPPEVDFYEVPADSANRTVNTLTNHFGTKYSHKMTHARYTGDFTQWHTVGVEWTPTELKYTLDGVVKARMTTNIPKQPMWLGIQTRPGSNLGVKPNASTPSIVDLEVDWVKIYRRA